MPHPASNKYTAPSSVPTTFSMAVNCTAAPFSTAHGTTESGKSEWESRAASVNNPKSSSGWRKPSSYYYQKSNFFSSFGDISARNSNCSRVYSGVDWRIASQDSYAPALKRSPFDRAFGAWRSNMVSWATTSAIAKLRQSDLMLGVTLAERAKAGAMVAQRMQGMLTFLGAIRSGQWGPMGRHFDGNFGKVDLFKWYLEYQFGWNQFAIDINALCELIESKENGSYDSHTVYVKSKVSVPYSATVSKQQVPVNFLLTTTGKEECRVRLDYTPKGGQYVTYRSLMSGFGDPASILWELVPFSFVVDYLVNIGKFLEGIAAVPAWKYMCGSNTTYAKYTKTLTASPISGYVMTGGSNAGSGEQLDFVRTAITIPPLPSIALNPNLLGGQLSLHRITILTALIMVALNRR